jgi:type IV pilus assembly protein PilW
MNTRKRLSGFSLVELMVALTIGLVILAVLGTVFSRTSSGRGDLERVTRLVENSRFAADIIGDDVRHAGFYGTFMPPTGTVYGDASPCGWNTTNVSTLGWQPNNSPPNLPAPLQGWDDPGATVPELNCLPNRVPGTDVLAIRRVSSIPIDRAGVKSTSVYVQASLCISDPALLRVSNSSADFDLRTVACDAAKPALVRRYLVRVYYVASCNDCTANNNAGDGIPTLKRFEVVDNANQVVSLAEGVQNLQFEYMFDTGTDGVPDESRTATSTPTSPPSATESWANVVGVRMHVLMRSSEPGLTVDTTPTVFNLGPNHTAETCLDRYKCRLLTTTFRLNNVAGRRET